MHLFWVNEYSIFQILLELIESIWPINSLVFNLQYLALALVYIRIAHFDNIGLIFGCNLAVAQ